MDIAQLDASVRVSAITASLLLAWLLFRQRRQIRVPAILFAPMAVCLTGFLIGNTPDPSLRLFGIPGVIAHFASGLTVVFLWWFCLACFDPLFRPRGGVLAVGLIWVGLATADRLIANPVPALTYTLVGLGFGIVAHLIWRLYLDREGDVIQKRYDTRLVVALLLGSQLLIDLSADLLFGFAWRPLSFALAQNVGILAFLLWLARHVLAAQAGVLSFEGAAPVRPLMPLPIAREDGSGAANEELRQRLVTLIEVDRIHLNSDLTFGSFVDQMKAPERAVRNLVNQEMGFDHFRSFLNHFRVIEARRILSDPRRSADKLIAVALDSGFASLPSFNRVFRATEGCSPSQFKDSAYAAHRTARIANRGAESTFAAASEKRSAAF